MCLHLSYVVAIFLVVAGFLPSGTKGKKFEHFSTVCRKSRVDGATLCSLSNPPPLPKTFLWNSLSHFSKHVYRSWMSMSLTNVWVETMNESKHLSHKIDCLQIEDHRESYEVSAYTCQCRIFMNGISVWIHKSTWLELSKSASMKI